MRSMLVFFLVLVLAGLTPVNAADDDPYLWLEDVGGEKPLEWVGKINEESLAALQAVNGYQEAYERILEVLDSRERIPFPAKIGDFLYNFWRDAENPRGVYRRTTMDEYRKADPAWETILDIDKLARDENENWVYKGVSHLYPDYERALVRLSRGGADAVVVREFDIPSKTFVRNGFELPEAKSNISWRDIDSVYVGTDFGPGSLTSSGYPRLVKLWRRGTPLNEAELLHEAAEKSMSAYGGRMFSEEGHLDFIIESTTFYTRDYFVMHQDKWRKLAVPQDVDFTAYFKKNILLRPQRDWTVDGHSFKAGSVLVAPLDSIISGQPALELLIEPTARMSIRGVSTTQNTLLVAVLDNVSSKLYQFFPGKDGKWTKKAIAVPENGSVWVFNTSEKDDDYFLNYTSFLDPPSLYFVSGEKGKLEMLKSQSAFFDASPYQVRQFEAPSTDGTMIPYFVIMAKNAVLDGKNPTLLYGYGGFEISMTPSYNGRLGVWLEKGGVYVIANIRGGGEFGPQWHQAALKKNRHKAFEDFIGVAEDLVKRKITRPQHLAIQGGSNGGLLVGAVFVMRPDLFRAVVCQVPLLDMKRYTKLLAGASWAAEYGDPDETDMWEYIKTYSPYQNVKKGVKYPVVFFTTSTRDDRVHPGHARKMVARMKEQGHRVYYFENTEGGHAGAANNEQRAKMTALGYAFLFDQLWPKAD